MVLVGGETFVVSAGRLSFIQAEFNFRSSEEDHVVFINPHLQNMWVRVPCRCLMPRAALWGSQQTLRSQETFKQGVLMSGSVCPLRWLKFEEDVEDGGDRWSKPYVATLSLHSLFELRSCILNGTVLLDMRASSIEEIAGQLLEFWSSLETDRSRRPSDVSKITFINEIFK